jgi:threonine synthase
VALGKVAQSLMHGARIVQVEGNFDDALRLTRELTERFPVALVNSVNPHRLEGPEDPGL